MKVYVDRRLAGVSRRFLVEQPDFRMRIPEPLLRCAVFLGVNREDDPGLGRQPEYLGTGFLVAVEHDGEYFSYVVTARHVVDDIITYTKKYPETSFVRVNDANGNAVQVSLKRSLWVVPDDSMVDLAVCPIENTSSGLCRVPTTAFVRRDQFREFGIGLGDEVFTVGLLRFVVSDKVNEPVVRYGNLAMIPSEPIATKLGRRDVYLIEARSIGGLSGSPVFVRETLWLNPEACRRVGDEWTETPPMLAPGRTFFLGVMRGHWDIDPSTIGSIFPKELADKDGGVNYGIALVTPAQKLLEILYGDRLFANREERMKAILTNRQSRLLAESVDSSGVPP